MLNTRMLKNIWPKYQKTFYWVSLMWYKHMKCTHSGKKLILKLKSMHETSIWFDHLEYFLVQKNLNTCRGFRSYNGIPNIYLNWNCILPNKICNSIQLFCTTYINDEYLSKYSTTSLNEVVLFCTSFLSVKRIM